MSTRIKPRRIAVIAPTMEIGEDAVLREEELGGGDIYTLITPSTFGEVGTGKFDQAIYAYPEGSTPPTVIHQVVDYLFDKGTEVRKAEQ